MTYMLYKSIKSVRKDLHEVYKVKCLQFCIPTAEPLRHSANGNTYAGRNVSALKRFLHINYHIEMRHSSCRF